MNTFEDIVVDFESLEIFSDVDTLGIFQFESTGMMNFLKKFKVNSFDEIVAAIALYRPGPMNNIDPYIKRKNNLEQVDYIVKELEPILKSTYGIIVYQEQIMQIANVLANYSLAEADILRKAMSKKKEDILLKEKDKFISKTIENGYSKDIANKVYDLILKFASYGFNKAHSVSYALIAYKMAYLKKHYYSIFMKNLLSMVIGSELKTKEYINACKGKIVIEKPNINLSENDYIIKDDKIIYPFTNIKNVGLQASNLIINERKNGNFKDIFDFFSRCYHDSVNIKVIESLNKAGCFNNLINEKTLDENIDVLINYSELGGLLEDSLKPELVNYQEYSKQEIMSREIEVFGTYLSNHPISSYRNKIKAIYLKDLKNFFNCNIISLVYVDKIKKVKTKNNEDMLFITGSDESSLAEFIVFPRNYIDINIGDICLIGKGLKWFTAGGIAFLISHAFFILEYNRFIDFNNVPIYAIIIIALVYILAVVFIFIKLKQFIPKAIFIPMFAYLLINGCMNSFAFYRLISNGANLATIITFIGALLFLISDTTLFFVRFNKNSRLKSHFLVMLTYSIGEFLIILGLIL